MKKYFYFFIPSIQVNSYIQISGNKGKESIYIEKIPFTLYKDFIFY